MRRAHVSPLFLLLAAAAVCWAPGCGGENPAGPPVEPPPEPLPTETLAGTLTLPPGWTSDPAGLRVVDVLAAAPVDSGGAFRLASHVGHRQLALALGPGGGIVLLGWFGDGATELSPRTTAEVLAWLAVGAWLLPDDGAAAVRDLLADPACDLSPLVAAWSAMLAADPGGLAAAHQGVRDALQAVADSLLAPQGNDKGVIVDPGAQQSGIEVLNTGGINRITIKNSYRRRAVGFLWRLGYQDTSGVDRMLPDPELVQEMVIPPVDGFDGTLSTIVGAVTGGVAYTPQVLEPIRLAWRDDARRDYYRFDALGMGVDPPADPDLYTAHELAQGEWTALAGMVLDFYLPLLLNAAGAGSLVAQSVFEDDLPGRLNDFISLLTTTVPDFSQQVLDGQFWPALHTLWDATFTNGILQEQVFDLVADALQAARFTAGEAEAVMEGVGSVFAYLGIADIIGGFADNLITVTHIGLCREADTWNVTVTSPVIHIEPRGAQIMAYGTQQLTLVIDDDTGGNPDGSAYAYHWSCPGRLGTLVDPNAPTDTSNDFFTSSPWVHYVADRGGEGTETVTCELYVTLGGERTLIRAAHSDIAVVRQHIVLADTMQTCPGGTVEMRPYLDPPYAGDGTVLWTWQGGGANGFLRGPDYQGAPWTSPNNLATFFVDADGGDDQVTCIASIELGDGTVSPVDTVTVVIHDVSEFEPYLGHHYCYTEFFDHGDGHCSAGWHIVVAFAEIPGVLRYHIHGSGFNDPLYYGTEFDETVRAQYLQHRDGELIMDLTSGGGSADCDDPPSEEELCRFLWRFEGAVWEITPVCP